MTDLERTPVPGLVRNDNIEIVKPAGVINEFKNIEIEQKFQILGKYQPSFLENVGDILLNTGNFQIVKGFEKFGWVFHFDYYAYEESGKIQQIFHTVHHESTPKFWIRKKLSSAQSPLDGSNTPLVRKEEIEIVNKPYSDGYVIPLVEQYQKLLGMEVFLLGRLTRQKRYTFLENRQSQRAYNISVDFCNFMDMQMSQLEIEYKWRKIAATEGYGDLTHLSTEMGQLDDILLSSPIGGLLEKTTLTKFNWMQQLRKEKGL